MSQISFADSEQAGKRKKTKREVFLGEMELVVPWKALLNVIEPHCPIAGRGRRPYPLQAMLRVHLMQNWFALSDPAMEEALQPRRGSIVDATLIAVSSATKSSTNGRDPEMHQTKKGNQRHFGMKAHIGVDADSGYRGAQSRVKRSVQWHIAGRPSDMAKMPVGRAKARALKQEYQKAGIRAKVAHPFWLVRRQFGLAKVRFKGLAKNTAHVITLFALSNLWMVRGKLISIAEQVRLQAACGGCRGSQTRGMPCATSLRAQRDRPHTRHRASS